MCSKFVLKFPRVRCNGVQVSMVFHVCVHGAQVSNVFQVHDLVHGLVSSVSNVSIFNLCIRSLNM